ncbi:SRPBCC domain-containing protein [Pseudactinotalea sp.]|uniref:SRPBCC domain-containing protein n=1 Tax=Pseudactinotalea sp. TaxID=1926260 RepID=UPI003B3B63B8
MTTSEMIDGARPAVQIRRRYPHPIDRVWRGLTESRNLQVWFPGEIDLRPEAGSVVRYGPGDEGRVEVAEPPARLAFTWGDDLLEFELIADGDATDLVLTHHFDDRAGAASFATGWEQCLAALTDVLEHRDPPQSEGHHEARHEELVERFALDRPAISRTSSGWHARFERQLICSADVAWDLFFGGSAAPAVGEEFRPFAAPEVVLGTVTECEPPRRFAFTTAEGEPGDEVRLGLGEGTGHGARLVLEVAGADEAELESAVDQWGNGAIGHVVEEAARLAGIG